VVIPAGEWVLPAISSANRDPAQYPDPDRLDPSELRWRPVSLMNGLESLPVRLT
jgi:cytochrome P450